MANIDDRVVSMSFENAKFQSSVTDTITALQKLNDSLKRVGVDNGLDQLEAKSNKVTLTGASSAIDKLKAKLSFHREAADGLGAIDQAGNKVKLDGPGMAVDKVHAKLSELGPEAQRTFGGVERAAGTVDFRPLMAGIDSVSAKFSELTVLWTGALTAISMDTTRKALSFAKGFGVGPILDGLHEYETNLKSIQTIQANTDRPLTEINRSLTELNEYSDKTIYNFSEMAKNIGTFTAAGVDLKTATSSIKGIANMAALSGSSSQQAATAMYQLSQAISSGRVGLQDWNSVVNAGMGGKKLQTALATTAIAMGKIGETSVKLEGPMKKLTINGQSFRESIMAKPGQQAWLSSEVLVNTLATLDGRFSKAALSAELTKDGLKKYTKAQIEASIADSRAALEKKNGVKYTDEQFKSLMKLSDSAFKSATEVKTLGQVFDVAKETIGSGWSASFQSIFGNLTEAKKTFTALSGAINGFINANALARNKVLHDWKALGGRTALIEGIKNVFKALGSVIKPIYAAFRDLFPAKTGKDLFELTKNFQDFTEKLKIGPETAENLKRSFRGVFAVFSIGKQILGGIWGLFKTLFGAITNGSGGVLEFTGGIGDMLVQLDAWLKKGDRLKDFFGSIAAKLEGPVELIHKFTDALGDLFDGFGGGKDLFGGFGNIAGKLKPSTDAVTSAKKVWQGLYSVIGKIGGVLDVVVAKMADVFGDIGNALADAFAGASLDNVFSVIQTTLVGGIFLAIKKAVTGPNGIGGLGSIRKSVTGVLDGLTGSLKAMQLNLHAGTLQKIATALLLLAVAVGLLSLIKPERLAGSMTALAVGLGQLVGGMALLMKIGGKTGFAKVPILAGGIALLAGAMILLAGAVALFSMLSWEELAKGLAGVGGAMAVVAAGMVPLQAASSGMMRIGISLIPLALGLTLVSAAVKVFSTLSWGEMAKGMAGVAWSLGLIAGAMYLMPPHMLVISLGLSGVGLALGLIAGAVLAFGAMDVGTLAKGLAAMAIALASIGLALSLMPPTALLSAAALPLVAIGLTGVAAAVALMGKLKIGTLIKGLVGLAAVLGILAVGLTLMVAALPGAAALLVAAGALAVLVPVIGILGTMKWSTIFKGLGAIALALVSISLAALVAAPGLLVLSAAMGVMGLGLLAIGGGVNLLAKGLRILGSDGAKGVAVVVAALTGMVAVLPKVVIDFIKGLVEIIAAIAKIAPAVVASLVKIINSLLDVIIQAAPKFGIAINAIIAAILSVIATNFQPILNAGLMMLTKLLQGISNNIGMVTNQVADIVLKFLTALNNRIPEITRAGTNVLVSMLRGIANNLARVTAAATSIVVKLIQGITNHITKVITAGANLVIKIIQGITSNYGRIITAGVTAAIKFVTGIAENIHRVVAAGVDLAIKFINAVARETIKLGREGAQAVIKFMHGVADAIREYEPQLIAAGADIALAIGEGIINGLGDVAKRVVQKAKGLAGDALRAIKNTIKSKSPSQVTHQYGIYIAEGLANGMASSNAGVAAASSMANNVIDKFREVFAIASPSRVMQSIGQFVGKGFAEGLKGSSEDIDAAFSNLRAKLTESLATLNAQILSEKKKLTEELGKNKKDRDQKEIAERRATLAELERLVGRTVTARALLGQGLKKDKDQLQGWAVELAGVAEKLKAAEEALASAVKTRDDAQRSFESKYSALPDIAKVDDKGKALSAEEQLAQYQQSLMDQTTAVAAYKNTLDQLRVLGLDDATYQKLLEEGTANQQFADQLLAGGKTAVDGLNALDAQLMSVSQGLAVNASRNLYQAGVDAAQGLVNGLKSQHDSLVAEMEKLAAAMIKAIKTKLKIKSPSQEFAKVGLFSVEGLARGLRGSTKTVTAAAGRVGDEAVLAMRDSMARVSEAMDGEIDPNPVISPVLDLNQVQREARKLAGLTNVTPITAATSYRGAAAIDLIPSDSSDISGGADGAKVFKFEQNIHSPTALSEAEIYRQTHNQLSQAKDALGL